MSKTPGDAAWAGEEEGEEVVVEEPKPINPYSYIPVTEKMLALWGDQFVDNRNEIVGNVQQEILNPTLIAVLFTSEWGSPCKIFEKDLLRIYDEVNEGEKIFEIIEVSFEKSEENFKKNIANKPWKFLPFNSEKKKLLKEHFQIWTIPKLFPLDKNGDSMSVDARNEINEHGSNMVESWIVELENEIKSQMKLEEGGSVNDKDNKDNKENKEGVKGN